MYGYSYGLYDWNGKEIIPIKYDRLNYLGDGYYFVGDKSFGVFKQGVGVIIPEQYKAIEYLGEDLFSLLNTTRLCGVVDSHNKQIIPFTYEYIFQYKRGYFIVGKFIEPEHREAYYNFVRREYALYPRCNGGVHMESGGKSGGLLRWKV